MKVKLKWIPWVVAVVFLAFVFTRLTEYEHIVSAFQRGELFWIGVALGFQIFFFLLFARASLESFRLMQVNWTYPSMLLVVMGAFFANVITPSLGLAGTAVFIREGRRMGNSMARVMTGFTVQTIFGQVGLVIASLLVMGGIALTRRVTFSWEILILGLVVVTLILQVLILWISHVNPVISERILSVVSSVVDSAMRKIRRKPFFPENWAKTSAGEMRDIVGAALLQKKKWPGIALITTGMHLSAFLALFCLFPAFGETVDLRAAFSGFLGSTAAGIVLIGPQGIGVMEAGITLVLSHYGVARGAASLIALVYRGLNFWLPMLVGFVSVRKLRVFE